MGVPASMAVAMAQSWPNPLNTQRDRLSDPRKTAFGFGNEAAQEHE